jgi:type IV pilus assembly protein PilE
MTVWTRHSGFAGFLAGLSLVELLIGLAIAAILLSFAVPSYQRYVQRGHRVDAIRMMLEMASCQERIRAGTGFYDTSRCQAVSGSEFYALKIEPPDEVATPVFTIIADPTGSGIEDICGSLSLDQAGTQGIGGDPAALRGCWSGR